MRQRFGQLAALLAAAALLAGPASAISGDGWTTYTVRSGGFTIQLPAGWKDVPQNDAALLALIRQLVAKHQLALANQYAPCGVRKSGSLCKRPRG